MKRNVTRLLLISLLALFCTVSHADPVRTAAVLLGDSFYAMDGQTLLRWQPETTPEAVLTLPAEADSPCIDVLFTWRDTLWGIDQVTGALTQFDPVNKSAVKPTLRLDWPDLYYENHHTYLRTGYEQVVSLFTLDDTLYLLHGETPEEGHEYAHVLQSFDLTSGARRTYDIHAWGDYYFNFCMVPYTKGKLLFASLPAYSDMDLRFTELDLKSGEATQLGEALHDTPVANATIGGLAYDPVTDTILVGYDHLIYRIQGDQEEIIGYTAQVIDNRMPGFLLPDHRYVLDASADWDTAQPSPLSIYDWNAVPLDLSSALCVAASFSNYSDCISAYALAHPEQMALQTETGWWAAGEALDALRAGETEADVLVMDVVNLTELGAQGVLADLQHEPWAAAYVSSLPPGIRANLTGPNGEIWGVLSSLSAAVWSTDPTLWEKAGLPLDSPTTWTEWIDLIVEWEADPAAHPGLKILWDDFSDYNPLIEDVLKAYVQRYQEADGSVDFFRPVLRDSLEKLNAVPRWKELSASMSAEERKAAWSIYDREDLIETQTCRFTNGTWRLTLGPFVDPATAKRVVLPPPTFAPGEAFIASTGGSLWCARADSPRLDQAIEYLHFQSEKITAPAFRQWPDAAFPLSLDDLLDMGQTSDELKELAYLIVEIPNSVYTKKDAPLYKYYMKMIDVDTLLATLQGNLDKALSERK